MTRAQAELIAQHFHLQYEEQARRAGWQTQEASRVPWPDLPAANRRAMVETILRVAAADVIAPGPTVLRHA